MAKVIKSAIFSFECNGELITGTCDSLVLGSGPDESEVVYRMPKTLSVSMEFKAKTVDEKITVLDLCSTQVDGAAN